MSGGRFGPGRADAWCLALLVLVPLLLYLPPALAGRPVMPGDDLVQNYPLRVLAGEWLRSGRVPAWDPYIWSGTPLLAGWNAGALFPGTWLFALLPGVAAWTADLVLTYAFCGVGAYLLLRRLGCRPTAAVVGALVLSYTGFMSGQVVHLGLVEGAALVPWMLLALDVLATGRPDVRGRGLRSLAAGTALLGLAAAMCVLAGDPRAVTGAAVLVAIQALAGLRGPWRVRARVLLGTGVGVALAAAASCAQWLQGLSFLHGSQRGVSAYGWYVAGSVPPGQLAGQLLLPFALGTNGNLGQPLYHASYNLPELTLGAGLVALIAAFALLPEALAPLARRVRIRPRRGTGGTGTGGSPGASRPLGRWYATLVVGILLTLGGHTPAGRLLAKLPLFGGQRLQNRNAEIVDLALAVLLAFFLDDVLGTRARHAARRASASSPLGSALSRALATLPPLAVVGTGAWELLAPRSLDNALSAGQPQPPGLVDGLLPYLALSVGLALVAAAAVHLPRWGPLTRRGAFVALALCDVGVYLVNAPYTMAPPGSLAPSTAESAELARLDGTSGRFAVYNPDYAFSTSAVTSATLRLGVVDLNLLRRLPSVQGYGSIVADRYDQATATHFVEQIAPDDLKGATSGILDLRTLVTLPRFARTSLAQALVSPRWTEAGRIGPLVVYLNHSTRGPAWLEAPSSRSAWAPRWPAAELRTSIDPVTGEEVMDVRSSRRALLVRSVAYEPGWRVRIAPSGGRPVRVVEARRLGLVQAVEIPPGSSRVTWRYRPPKLAEGLLVSLAGAGALALVALGGLAAGALGGAAPGRPGGRRRRQDEVPGRAPAVHLEPEAERAARSASQSACR